MLEDMINVKLRLP